MSGNAQQEKKNNRQNLLILFMLFITICAVAVSCWALWFREDKPILPPDYAPIDEDKNAFDIAGDDGDTKLDAEEGGGAVGLTFTQTASIDLSDKTATVFFQNPGRSVCDVVVQIVIQDKVIAQSGKLVPGKQITKMELTDGAAEMLTQGGYNGYFVISMYDSISGEKAIVNTQAPINITVQN